LNKKQHSYKKHTTPAGWAHPLNLTEGLRARLAANKNQHQTPDSTITRTASPP